MAALARWCVRHRLVTVLLWLGVLGGTGAAAAVAGVAYTASYEANGTESDRATALLAEASPGRGGDSATVVWHTERGTVCAADVEQTMNRTLDEIAGLPGVAAVDSPYGEQAAGRVSDDGRTAYAVVTFDDPVGGVDARDARAVADTAAAARGDGLRVELGGGAVALTQTSGGHTAEIVGVLVSAVVLFLAFGSLVAALLPIATALVGVGTAYAGTVLLGHAMTVADFAPMLGMLIGLGVGIDYALFVVTRHRRGLKSGLTVAEAARNAVATTGRAVVFAGVTVCVSLLGMLILRLGFLDGVAVAASLTVLLTVAASVTLLPALLSWAGPRALSRRERRRLAEHGPEPELPTGSPPAGPPSSNAAPSSSAPSPSPSWCCSPCPPSRCAWAPPTRATTPGPPPPGRPTTCSRRTSGPASTDRSSSSPGSATPRTGSRSTPSATPCGAPRASPP